MAWSKSKRIMIMLVIDVIFLCLELSAGLLVHSLALMADAFHMLNDVISLAIGLWAVKVSALRGSDVSEKYSFGYMRAEILGAFFNAVFLIALCFSILIESVQRFIDPPEISNPVLILIIGSLGLTSNLAGFLVLGGHGHSHGPGEKDSHGHSHDHDDLSTAEEGHSHGHDHGAHDHSAHSHEEATIRTPKPVTVVKKGQKKQKKAGNDTENLAEANDSAPRQVNFSTSHNNASGSLNGASSTTSKHQRRRTSSINRNTSLLPSSIRQDIIGAANRMDDIESEDPSSADEDVVDADEPSETSALLAHKDGHAHKGSHSHSHNHENGHDHDHDHDHASSSPDNHRHDSTSHSAKPKKVKKASTGHNHADLGMSAMILHVAGDALGNIGVMISALIIWLTTSPYRFYADPAVSLLITAIILYSTIPLTRASAKILLQATPDHIDVNEIKQEIERVPGVVSCHHVHIWQLSDSQLVASLHIQVEFPITEEGGSERYMQLSREVKECLHKYEIHSATIQPEFCLDKSHDHTAGGIAVDGDAARDSGSDVCLLECVDDCTGDRCCPPAADGQPDQATHGGAA